MKYILLLLVFTITTTGCVQPSAQNIEALPQPASVAHQATKCVPSVAEYLNGNNGVLHQHKTVAVSYVYDELNGNVTALGELFRQTLERELHATGCNVKIRKDLNLVMQESEFFGGGFDVAAMDQLQADILYLGSYRVVPCGSGDGSCALLSIKASRVDDATVIDLFQCEQPLPQQWARLAGTIKGNIYQQQVKDLDDDSAHNKPRLYASLDRDPACYCAGDSGQVTVETEPGCFVYLLNLAADNSVTLLYPNSMMPQRPVVSGKLIFPPSALQQRLQLQFYPLKADETVSEVIKVISSHEPLDFDYLPVPENQLYKGAQGGDIKKMAKTLQQVHGWSEQTLTYFVGSNCAE